MLAGIEYRSTDHQFNAVDRKPQERRPIHFNSLPVMRTGPIAAMPAQHAIGQGGVKHSLLLQAREQLGA